MCVFQSEQVINCNSDLKITSLIFKLPDLNPVDYRVWGAILGRYTRQNQPTNITELKTALLSILNDLPQELSLIDKAILSF